MANKFLDLAGVTYLWSKIKERFVEKETGKGLFSGSYTDLINKPNIPTITNDLTDSLKKNYDSAYSHSTGTHAPTNAQANVIESVKVNGVALTPTSKAVDVPVPTKTSQITNDSSFQTLSDVQSAINEAIKGISGIDFQVVSELPATGLKGTIYLKSNGGTGTNIYDEYIWVNSKFEFLGTTTVDLTNYLKKTDMQEITNAEIDTICV